MKYGHASIANPAPNQDNCFFEHNQMFKLTATGVNNTHLRIGTNSDISNWSVRGNICEVSVVSSSAPIFWIGGDGSTFALTNMVFAHNTTVGERWNFCYNDDGTSAVQRTSIFSYGNAVRSFNIKSDLFPPIDANRIGNWRCQWAVNWHDNIYDGTASSSFVGDYDGADTTYELSGTLTTFGELGFVDEQSSDLGTAGNGDYTPDTGSVLLDQDLSPTFLGFDSYGTANFSNEVGAVFIDVPVVAGGDNITRNLLTLLN